MIQEYFRVSQEQSVEVLELSLPFHLDTEEFNRFSDAILELFPARSAASWVLDLSGSAYMGSSVLGLMVNIRQRVKEAGGRLALCGLSSQLTRVFQTCCLEKLFTIKAERNDALKAVAG